MSSVRHPRLGLETLDARLVPSATVLDLTVQGSTATAPSGAIVQQVGSPSDPGDSQFGSLRSFLRLDGWWVEQGYNSDNRRHQFDTENCGTQALTLGQVSVVSVGGVAYREFLLDANEQWWSPNLSLDELRIFLADTGDLRGYNTRTEQLAGRTAVFDLDSGGDVSVKINARLNRGGSVDMVLLIPDAAFAGASADTFVYLYSKFGDLCGARASGGDEIWSVRRDPVTPPDPTGGSISGIVRLDNNQDEEFDQDDVGIGGVIIHLDRIDDQGMVIPVAVTETLEDGTYSFTGLLAGRYIIWEEQPMRVDKPDTPYADGKDYLGSIEGTTDETLWGIYNPEDEIDQFFDIQLGTDQHGVNYIFTEFMSDNLP